MIKDCYIGNVPSKCCLYDRNMMWCVGRVQRNCKHERTRTVTDFTGSRVHCEDCGKRLVLETKRLVLATAKRPGP
jgi:hypothetical protein